MSNLAVKKEGALAKPIRNPKGLHVLVVSANPIRRWMLRVTLETVGHKVVEVESAQAAYPFLTSSRPDLVLQELQVSDVSSSSPAAMLPREANARRITIMAFAEEAIAENVSANMRQLFQDFLVWPFLPSYLLMSLQFRLQYKYTAGKPPLEQKRAQLSRESFSEMADRARANRGPANQHILVAEDSIEDSRELVALLEEAGYQTTSFCNGLAAVEEALRTPPDAIVTDTLMPSMSGFELCLFARLAYQLALVPILLTPAGPIEEIDRKVAVALGATSVVSRQPDFHKILDSLAVILLGETPALTQGPNNLPADRRQLLTHYH